MAAGSRAEFVGGKLERADLWKQLRDEALEIAEVEHYLRDQLTDLVISQGEFKDALARILSVQLHDTQMPLSALQELCEHAASTDPSILAAAVDDLAAVFDRDPAANSYLMPFLYFKGFHAIQWHRIAHCYWKSGRCALALFLQSRVSRVFAVDIHPAVPVGRGVFIDHGTGIVIGETAVIGDNVSILHEVTLGGTGKQVGDRHPKIADGVLLAAGAKILGNIQIGRGAKIGAGSVVVKSVPAWSTAVGNPARVVASGRKKVLPALDMNQALSAIDYCI